MKMYWEKTGDSINLDVTNQEVFEYYIDFCNQNNSNKFFNTEPLDVDFVLSELQTSLDNTVANLKFFKITDLETRQVSLEQNFLNKLHEDWVNLNKKYVGIGDLLGKKFPNGLVYFDNVNLKIHQLEDMFEFFVDNSMKSSIKNIFGGRITSLDYSNIFIHSSLLGRTSYSKWHHFDQNNATDDQNDFYELTNMLGINLNRPYTVSPFPEYIEWCKNNNIAEYCGDKITLANFQNLEENLTLYRELFRKNFIGIDNPIIFTD